MGNQEEYTKSRYVQGLMDDFHGLTTFESNTATMTMSRGWDLENASASLVTPSVTTTLQSSGTKFADANPLIVLALCPKSN
jgi:hypothetical protein